jgi:hypothetical protein
MFVLTDTPKEFIPSTELESENPLTFIVKPPTKRTVLDIQETLFKSLDVDENSDVSVTQIPLAELMDNYINACVVGWKNVVDEDNNPIIFSKDKLELFNDTVILMELYNYCKELTESTEKN